jgi:hypothetical protein
MPLVPYIDPEETEELRSQVEYLRVFVERKAEQARKSAKKQALKTAANASLPSQDSGIDLTQPLAEEDIKENKHLNNVTFDSKGGVIRIK